MCGIKRHSYTESVNTGIMAISHNATNCVTNARTTLNSHVALYTSKLIIYIALKDASINAIAKPGKSTY